MVVNDVKNPGIAIFAIDRRQDFPDAISPETKQMSSKEESPNMTNKPEAKRS